ncbi:uncharacterized protein LOC111008787 [Momordica charantia]|uniref:Uncharacterized protein LOC111008787 n=1 Tax=Momordica charantia TaxID=3673 RepID=A0A6J1C6U1_MOMCH|nr:uncharacterized protein LOC111008787 [Momordica charantia]
MATASSSPLLPDQQQTPAGGGGQSSGSIGPFFAVISVLTLLSILSCFLGRICSRGSEETPLQSRNCLRSLKGQLQRRCVKDVEVGVKGIDLGDGAAATSMDRKFYKDCHLQNPSSS